MREAADRHHEHLQRAESARGPAAWMAHRGPGLTGLVVAVLLAGGLGCAGTDTGTSRPSARNGAVGDAVRTYGGTLVAPGPLRLLDVAEVRPLISFGFDLREQPVLDPKQFTITTLRGPCGAAVNTPFRPEGGFRVFRSTISLIIEALAEPGSAAGTSFIDAFEEDERPGCPSFDEQIGNGTSTVRFVRRLDLPQVGDRRFAWLHEVKAPDGKVGYRSTVVVVNGTRVMMLAVLAAEPPNDIQLQELVRLAAIAE